MARRIFIGDIQGCRTELEQLLEAVAFDPSGDELHPVGDFVNRGPDSGGVLRLMRQLGAGGVLGNHDLHALRAQRGRGRDDERDTLHSLILDPEGADLLRWLAQRPFIRTWPDIVCVHAGVHPHWQDPAAVLRAKNPWRPDHDVAFVTRVRHCDPHGEPPRRDDPPPPLPYRPWDDYWRARPGETRTIVFGHWAQRGLVVEERTRGLDTGCVWGGRLTAWIAEEDRLVHVPARRAWSRIG
ncbi:MAG: metallophosphoesterase [Planctomycetota bacterium]